MPLFMASGGPFGTDSYREFPTTHIAVTMFQIEHRDGPLKVVKIQPSGRKVKVFERTT
jgi:hypothetical protein